MVMIDELAAMTAYCPERDLQRRAEMAINLLCSQGRAPGFVVFACLQDPRKEVIPSRGLFTQMVGLRLKDADGDLDGARGGRCRLRVRSATGSHARCRGRVTWCRRTVGIRCGCAQGSSWTTRSAPWRRSSRRLTQETLPSPPEHRIAPDALRSRQGTGVA